MPTVTQYETEDGKLPFDTWFLNLNTKAALKVETAIARMESGNLGDHKSVGSGVLERRINFEKGYRIYFARDGDKLILLLCGGTKARQNSDIQQAKDYWSAYKRRKSQEKKIQGDTSSVVTPKKKKRK